MYKKLKDIHEKPAQFSCYTAAELWTNEHTARQMLVYHLNGDSDVSSRNSAFIDRSVKWIVSRFGVTNTTAIADFGCGPGLYAEKLAETNADVSGINFSANSINYAKITAAKKSLTVDYIHADYLTFDTEKKFDLIIMIMCDFCALSPVQRKTLLAKFRKFLAPDGRLLLDVYSLNCFTEKTESASVERYFMNGFSSPNDYFCFINSFRYEKEKVTLDKYTVVEETGICTVYKWFQYFSRNSLKKEFAENGFTADEVYADVAGTQFDPDSREFAVVAKKKTD